MVLAFSMVRQNFDNPALIDGAMGAARHHPLKFGLQRGKAGNALLNVCQPGAGDLIRRRARLAGLILQHQQGADCIDLEPKLAGMADEGQPPQVVAIILAPVALATRGRGQQPNLFVKADRRALTPLCRAASPIGTFPLSSGLLL